jgi:hypothetical protein
MSWTLGILGRSPSGMLLARLVSVDGRMEFLLMRPWFKSELDTQNSREESNIMATLAPWVCLQLGLANLFGSLVP